MTNANATDKCINELKKITSASKDAAEFYEAAQDKVRDASLQETFREMAKTHKSTLDRVEALLQKRDASHGRDEASTTLAGNANRAFGEIMSVLSNDPDAKLVERLEEAEDRCLESLQSAADLPEFEAEERNVLKKELQERRSSHDRMKKLKDSKAA